MLAAALLALGVMVIVGNTIRLDIQNRRAEIEVTKLVGGSDAFVRRPFLYSGVWYGLGGGVTAWLITLRSSLAVLREPVGRLAGLYGSDFRSTALAREASALLLVGGVVLGWLGSYIAATRHLRPSNRPEPPSSRNSVYVRAVPFNELLAYVWADIGHARRNLSAPS